MGAEMRNVNSATIKAEGYDVGTGEFIVIYQDGTTKTYVNVPPATAAAVIDAPRTQAHMQIADNIASKFREKGH